MHGIKENLLMWNWFYLANPPMMFVGWGVRARTCLMHFSFVSMLCLGDPQWSLIAESVAWMLDWQAVWTIPFLSVDSTTGGLVVSVSKYK